MKTKSSDELLDRLAEEFLEACEEGNFRRVLNIMRIFKVLSSKDDQ